MTGLVETLRGRLWDPPSLVAWVCSECGVTRFWMKPAARPSIAVVCANCGGTEWRPE